MNHAPKRSRVDDLLAEDMGRFYADPLGFVLYAYPWDTDPDLQVVRLPEPWASRYGLRYGPDAWACEMLEDIGRQVEERGFDGRQAVDPQRHAISSGHGIGKSAMAGWLTGWIMSTRPHSMGTITANTGTQLSTKTWAQVLKWMGKCITGHWFESTAAIGNLRLWHKDHKDTWFVSAQTCREENSEAFAGQHAASSTSWYLYDEASAVPDKIWEVSEGGLTDGESMQFVFGNPTRNTGRFRECFRKYSARWTTRQIDSRDVQVTNKAHIKAMIEDYGLDSDVVKVRVLGQFPSAGSRQLIESALIDAAFGRYLRPDQYEFAPVVLGVDPAWTGEDALVVYKRQGLYSEHLLTIPRNDDDVWVAGKVAQLEVDHKADGVIVDMGYGTGIVSAGRAMGREWHLVNFSAKSPDVGCLNMRAYMWDQIRVWLREGGAIPKRQSLRDELEAVETVSRLDGKKQLESKDDVKERLGRSPNEADALALTFAVPIAKRQHPLFEDRDSAAQRRRDYKPTNSRRS